MTLKKENQRLRSENYRLKLMLEKCLKRIIKLEKERYKYFSIMKRIIKLEKENLSV